MQNAPISQKPPPDWDKLYGYQVWVHLSGKTTQENVTRFPLEVC